MSEEKTYAIRIERHGPPAALKGRELPLPQPGRSTVRLRVDAAGVNFADLLMRQGLYGTVPSRPYSPGFEVAGTVTELGPDSGEWRAGDRAVALIRHGGYARDIIVPTRNLFRYPDSLSFVEAAAIPVNFLTAWFCLFEAAHARRGETALVLGAGGGVGTAAVQLAVRRGIHVVGTAGTPEKRRFVIEELGAAACFDSRDEWEPEVRELVGERGLDLALDPVGGAATRSCRRLLGPLGRLVFFGLSEAAPGKRLNWLRAAWAWLRTPRFHPLSLIEPNIGVHGIHLLHLGRKEPLLRPALEEIYGAVADGELRPVIDRVFRFDREGAVAAHTYLHERRNLGKVVLAESEDAAGARRGP